jgi:osmotically-inducible protein OsmY
MIEANYFKAAILAIVIVALLLGCALEGQAATDARREDARIAANVQAVIDQHPDLGPPNFIYVDVRDHVVYLSGLVNTDLTVANAEALAHQVPGVARVVGSIGVEN